MSGDVEELEAITETGHHVTGASGHEVHHGLGDTQYLFVFVALVIVTAMEVSLTYMNIGAWFLPLMITLMLIKFFSVVLFFMHLRFDNKLYSVLFYMGLGLAAFVYIFAMFTFHVFDI